MKNNRNYVEKSYQKFLIETGLPHNNLLEIAFFGGAQSIMKAMRDGAELEFSGEQMEELAVTLMEEILDFKKSLSIKKS